MSIITVYNYNAGIDNGDWTNEAYAWDGSNNSDAYRIIPASTSFETLKWIKGTGNDAPISGNTISKVEIGVEASSEYSDVNKLRLIPVFNGTTDGDNYDTTYLSTTDSTLYFDITFDSNAPISWSWSDINNLDTKICASNDDNSFEFSVYIDQIYIRVSTLESDELMLASKKLHFFNLITHNPNSTFSSDNFDDNSINNSIWTVNGGGAGLNTEQNNRLEQTTSSTSLDFAELLQINSTDDFNITVKVVEYNNSDAYHILGISYYDWIGIHNGMLYGQIDGSSSSVLIPTPPFWLRANKIGSVLYFYYSTNGTTWTDLKSGPSTNNCSPFLDTENTYDTSTINIDYTTANDDLDQSSPWTNVGYAVDSSNDLRASADVSTGSFSYVSNTIRATANNNIKNTDVITKVEAKIEYNSVYSGSPVYLYVQPVFNGTDGDEYSVNSFASSGVDATVYSDITNSSNAPSSWSWADINNLDLKIHGHTTSSGSSINIDLISLRVTYTSVIYSSYTYWDDFVNKSWDSYDTQDINLYTSKCASDSTSCMNVSFSSCVDGTNISYAQLTSNLSHEDCTDLRIRKGTTTYGFLSTFDKTDSSS